MSVRNTGFKKANKIKRERKRKREKTMKEFFLLTNSLISLILASTFSVFALNDSDLVYF